MEKEIQEFLSTRIARFKIPKYIQIIKEHELPKTATGKIQAEGTIYNGLDEKAA